MTGALERLFGRRRGGPRLREATYVVLDTELSGLDREKDAVVSIGAIRMRGAAIEVGSAWTQLIDPGRALSPANILIHRLMPDELLGKPGVGVALRALKEFAGDAVLVGHFVGLDLAFARRDLRRLGLGTLGNASVDTAGVAQWLHMNRKRYPGEFALRPETSLFALAAQMEIPVTDAHDALSDAWLTAQIWQRQIPQLEALGIGRVGDLRRVRVAARFP